MQCYGTRTLTSIPKLPVVAGQHESGSIIFRSRIMKLCIEGLLQFDSEFLVTPL